MFKATLDSLFKGGDGAGDVAQQQSNCIACLGPKFNSQHHKKERRKREAGRKGWRERGGVRRDMETKCAF